MLSAEACGGLEDCFALRGVYLEARGLGGASPALHYCRRAAIGRSGEVRAGLHDCQLQQIAGGGAAWGLGRLASYLLLDESPPKYFKRARACYVRSKAGEDCLRRWRPPRENGSM